MEPFEVDGPYVERCLVYSVSTLNAMSPDRLTTALAQGRHDVLREAIEGYGWTAVANHAARPNSTEITDMDEIAWWLRFIRQRPIRRIVAMRAAVHPVSERPVSFRTIGRLLIPLDPLHPEAVKRWHRQGIEQIVAHLRAGEGGRLPVLPESPAPGGPAMTGADSP
jgi:hypothetical protein